MTSKKTCNGFTLVELSIVVIVIGVLIAGILMGQELIANSRVTGLISQQREIKAAYETFKKVYGAMPGDMINASDRLRNCNAGSSCENGDGDDWIGAHLTGTAGEAHASVPSDMDSESVQFWKHLAAADMLGGINASASAIGFGQTHPEVALGGGFHVRSATAVVANTVTLQGLVLVLRKRIDGQIDCAAASPVDYTLNCEIAPAIAYKIDKKIDDGFALTGNVQSVSPLFESGCGVVNTGVNGPNGYKTDDFKPLCDMMFELER